MTRHAAMEAEAATEAADAAEAGCSADEHVRYAYYLRAFRSVPADGELDLVATVLRDEDQVMAQAAVVHHVNLRAAALGHGPDFTGWVTAMTEAVEGRPFILQRIREWSLSAAITHGGPWDADALTSASYWLQRRVAETTTSPRALAVLSQDGGTRRIRNLAKAGRLKNRC
ncbi:hypothetical protein [Streptomyces sp. CB01881]|uniref:hypothetical protein n=1 Tax=Streptomyces sp. CB01881 TaxID=2078691 RepID=UPI000CDBF38D|nr:hypothetical protein [Streptomyces sp. CB01881]AUY52361.1 hypothetical protein C2142_29400 [Streptomyces sp. CB01881]TYC71784.1 hypothetical protein EH183_29380 [Streptomyces sp. CB01881]